MVIRRYWAVCTIAMLCILCYVLEHIVHWQTLEIHRLAWRGIARDSIFSTSFFWSFAPVSTVLHTGPIHLALNLWCLATLGSYLERRDGGVAIICLWGVSAYIAMGAEAWIGGVGRIGLSAVTYAMLGAILLDWREASRSPRRAWTGGVMLVFLTLGGLELLGLPPVAPEVAHVAHAAGLITGLIFALAWNWKRQVGSSG
ncbi:rhomboid family intramembrane serine protease [Sphingomonas sp. R86521]|uniref:rhomboid family intramembrane serine protease n=1 Tax=Sphingomonas sp. R86521 TaxID=3093860 RepID=UPI0036D407F7